jgi:phosphatidate cytidylyltransferase
LLRWRLLLGAALIGGLAALCWLDATSSSSDRYVPPGGWLFPLAVVACLLASGEILWLLRDLPQRPVPWIVYLGNLLIVGSNILPFLRSRHVSEIPLGPLGWPAVFFTLSMLIAFLGEMARYEKPGGIVVRLSLSVFAFAYVGILLSFVVQLRLINWPLLSDVGVAALVSMITVVKMGDTGAYTVGRLWGRHKMAPVLSPGKTWEGFAGHIAGACLGAWVGLAIFRPWITGSDDWFVPGPGWIIYGVLVGVAGLLGDLAESLLKRDVGAKDSSAWMPGFGGVLDVLDSILFAAPVAYLCWISGLVGR